jgi:integrase
MIKRLRPPKVHVKDGSYYYVDHNKWNRLSRVDDGLRELYRRLAILTDQPPNTLAGIFTAYAEGPLQELAASTRKQYEYFLFGILTNTFGHSLPSDIEPMHVAQFLELSKDTGGPVAGNRAKACLSSVYEFAMRKGWAKSNPCRGVRRNKERQSVVDIATPALEAAIDKAPDHFAHVMQLGHLTGIRNVDLRNLKVQDITPEGICYTESKTKKRVTMTWTDALRELVREILEARSIRMNRPWASKYRQAKRPRPPVMHDYLLTNRFGKPLTERGIISNMQRLDAGFAFRHIRPKAQTDAGDERNVLGHVGQMRERYTRRRKLVPVR